MKATKIGIIGSSGRMGSLVQKLLKSEYKKKAVLFAAPSRGEPLDSLLSCDVIIDFSLPEATTAWLRFAAKKKAPPAFVTGTTGFTKAQSLLLKNYSKKAPVLSASNFSVGVFIFLKILKFAQPYLSRLGYEPMIVETHHKHKKDAPSGTAKSIQMALDARHPETIPTHSVRRGEVVGEHFVGFYGPSDELFFQHRASNREIFARGAIDVALWLAKKKQNRCYTIEDYGETLK